MPTPPQIPPAQSVRTGFRLTGTVQGVGFRPAVYALAVENRLAGWVANDGEGVVGEVEGAVGQVDAFVEDLRGRAPPLAVVDRIELSPATPDGGTGFRIRPSITRASATSPTHFGGPVPSGMGIPADRSTCDACMSEVRDPRNRRYRHPFTNCTNCGPRLSIVENSPYDRAGTAMAGFPMCSACAGEYADPADRRFHAEAICCPGCGPRLALSPEPGNGLEPVAATAEHLAGGGLVAIKGLGGYHLAARAGDEDAVARLRRLKARGLRPFAVMVSDMAAASVLCRIGDVAATVLADPRAPIVLVERREGADVAASVAPDTDLLGLFLPYTALHHLLMETLGEPLVLTSANLGGEPMIIDDAQARLRLAGHVDAVLSHDRRIVTRVDDSVVRAIGGVPRVIRRARGYVPEVIRLDRPVPEPVLAVGADLKSTVCVAIGDRAYVSSHLGDLSEPASVDAYHDAVDRLLHMTDVVPDVVAHDLHPGYTSTRFAESLGFGRTVGVQHHHAHIAACLAEHGRSDPVLGVAFDGLGYGTDGTAWGGELLLVGPGDLSRLGHLEPVNMPGGAAAITQGWRMASSYLQLAEADSDTNPLGVRDRHAAQWNDVARLALSGFHSPVTTSMGRLFDAVAALCGAGDVNTYEGQAATSLERLAIRAGDGRGAGYPASIREDAGILVMSGVDLVGAVVADLQRGVAPELVAARFHSGVVSLCARALIRLSAVTGITTVALSGGAFQNALLLEGLSSELRRDGFEVLDHRRIPSNDAGISLGQALVAGATVARDV